MHSAPSHPSPFQLLHSRTTISKAFPHATAAGLLQLLQSTCSCRAPQIHQNGTQRNRHNSLEFLPPVVGYRWHSSGRAMVAIRPFQGLHLHQIVFL